MNSTQLEILCKRGVDNIIDRMHYLCADGRISDAQALYNEIRDWIVEDYNIEVLSLDYLNEFDS